ncbi:MAG TPA: hypothetical protein VNZ86_08970, partial [Bacteroidia bacterium]|nr:hypothetical protein [Bacteroidia bacterium]
YYVSLGISYPNKADRIWGGRGDLGGAIMIHGNCVTIGCVPLTDDIIKEVYVLAAEARNGGQTEIPVHLFPTALTAGNMDNLVREYAFHPDLIRFWKNLKQGYDYFEAKQILPEVTVSATGDYLFR